MRSSTDEQATSVPPEVDDLLYEVLCQPAAERIFRILDLLSGDESALTDRGHFYSALRALKQRLSTSVEAGPPPTLPEAGHRSAQEELDQLLTTWELCAQMTVRSNWSQELADMVEITASPTSGLKTG